MAAILLRPPCVNACWRVETDHGSKTHVVTIKRINILLLMTCFFDYYYGDNTQDCETYMRVNLESLLISIQHVNRF